MALTEPCARDSQLMKEDDNTWPMPDRVGRQELEVVMGSEHISFTTTKLGSLLQVWPSLPLGPGGTAVNWNSPVISSQRRSWVDTLKGWKELFTAGSPLLFGLRFHS